MKNEIYDVATENNCDYGIRVIVCEDAETVMPWSDPTGNGNEDECNSVCRDTHAAIRKLLFPVSAESDSHFQNWNGGMYSHQDYSVVSFGVVECFVRAVAVEDEDGDLVENDWEEIKLDKMPQSVIRAIEAVEEAHTKAIREVEAAQDAEQEMRDAEEAAEEAAEEEEAAKEEAAEEAAEEGVEESLKLAKDLISTFNARWDDEEEAANNGA